MATGATQLTKGEPQDNDVPTPVRNLSPEAQNCAGQESNDTTATQNNDASHEQLAQSWRVWKNRQGSGSNGNRKLSSVDPLKSIENVQTQGTSGLTTSQVQSQHTQNQNQNQWYSYLNPLSYVPQDAFKLQLPDNLRREQSDNQSAHSTLTASSSANTTGWFGWTSFLNPAKHITEPHSHETLDSIELKKNIKDAKKAINSTDCVWAWYQNHFNNNKSGKLSVLNTKTEITPVELKKYPFEPQVPSLQDSTITPSFENCFRNITTKTKVRLATELYYNFPTEKHIYIKKNIHNPLVQYVLIISVNNSSKRPSTNAFQLTELATQAMQNWYTDKEANYDYQIETVSLEVAKITNNTLEDLFKLLINWRETFKSIDFVLVVGLRVTVPLAASLLNILISRNLFESVKKTGLLLLDGNILNPYLEPAEQPNLTYSVQFDMTVSRLVHHYNTKITLVGSLANIPSTLALHFSHPNIFRNVLLPKNTYDDRFETHLFKILLMSSNLGHPSTRLLIQISKYFIPQNNTSTSITPSFAECLNPSIFQNALENSLSSTSLIRKQQLKIDIIDDPILDNNYNMVWTLHAFIDDFKKIKNINSFQLVLQLLSLYKKWTPQSKSLKDLKYMLEVLEIEDYSGTILRPT